MYNNHIYYQIYEENNMNNVKSFAERSKDFEQSHYSCKELLQDQMQKIENYTCKWLLVAIASMVLIQIAGFTYFYFELIHLRKKIDHRYLQTEEVLGDIHKVKIENGKVVRDYKKD